jgi:protein SCO1/2
MPRRIADILALSVAVLLLGAGAPAATHAQQSGYTRSEFEGVGIERKHGTRVPGDLVFRNAAGERVTLDRYLDGSTPVVLNLVYHNCPMLCGLMLEGITKTMQRVSWTPGQQYRVLTVSFNPRETPATVEGKRKTYLERLGKPGAEAGWHWLTGPKSSIEALTDSVGFNYRWVRDQQEYAHPTALIFLSGDGTVTRYIYGTELEGGDFRKALVEASNGTIGTPVDQVAMYCFQFDPEKNTYTADAFNIMKLASALTVVVLGGGLAYFWRRERRLLEAGERWADEREAMEDRDGPVPV